MLRQVDFRTEESFAYICEIQKPFGAIDTIINWCKSELQDDWRWQLIDVSSDQRPGRYMFYFDNNKDYFAFVLKWL
jgi:hypothetical protein